MFDIVRSVLEAPIANVLIVAGLIFLGIAVLGKVRNKIDLSRTERIIAGFLGSTFFVIGLLIHTWPTAKSPTMTGGQKVSPDVVTIETFRNRARFVARLNNQVHFIDFDDVNTGINEEPVAIEADRYKPTTGIIISGEGGQYVDETFGYPDEFVPVSSPNMYAPGPIGDRGNLGGNQTIVSFSLKDVPATVARFGLYFIDADYPGIGQSSLTVYGDGHRELASINVSGSNAEQFFTGFVAVDQEGNPVPVIRSARIVNGRGWPVTSESHEGVTLDDFEGGVDMGDGIWGT